MRFLNDCEAITQELSSRRFTLRTSFGTTDMESSCPEQIARCQALCAAMLINVIMDLRGEGVTNKSGEEGRNKRMSLRREARAFVMDDSTERFSFLWLCEQLDVDVAKFIREEVEGRCTSKWQRQQSQIVEQYPASLVELTTVTGT